MIDLSTVLSAALGTLIAGALLMPTAPLWWRWVSGLKIRPWVAVLGVLGLYVLLVAANSASNLFWWVAIEYFGAFRAGR